MGFKKISTRMFTFTVPVLIISMFLLSYISISTSRKIITEQVNSRMNAELSAAEHSIEEKLKGISTMAVTIAEMVVGGYENTPAEGYEIMLSKVIASDEMVLGSGLWFEPYAFSADMQYFGPYIYKDGGNIVTTYEYSNSDYDYFNQEYYTNAKNSKATMITDPYYDEVSGLIMSTCSTPIMKNGLYIGCVTVDIELSSITDMIDEIKVGDSGRAVMLDSTGIYLAGVSDDYISKAVKISEDKNASIVASGKEIMANKEGISSYKSDSGAEQVYYTTVTTTGWKFFIHILESEIFASTSKMMKLTLLVSVIAILVDVIVIFVIIRDVSKKTIMVKDFTGELAKGNFTVEQLKVTSVDEIGVMGNALNEMYRNNKSIISGIAGYATSIDESASKLGDASRDLENQFEDIKTMTGKVTDEMSTTSSATEEVNASSEEVLSNVTLLTAETENSMSMSNEIQARASKVAEQSRQSFETAKGLTEKYEKELQKSMEGAKVVDNVSSLADVISNIAGQINLLSLNASIESARAGEAGRGFAVVANEIGSLANSTSQAVSEIQSTIADVQKAFTNLMGAAKGLLDFLQNTVTPDYRNFVDVADQYGKDAQSFKENSGNISSMADNIKTIIGEVTIAIQDIADATTETTDISRQILDSVEVVSGHVSAVADMSEKQQSISDALNDTVRNFTL
ncbi:MAG: methyl-accepting chemotaxis protein [Lachnospiraceae bacterium]|nr:methyl-accepting chemotaxis protein [Lachnospiraceae bacterium]